MKNVKFLSIILFAFMVFSVMSCSTLTTVTPQTPKEKIYALNGLVTSLAQTTLTLYQNGKITKSDVATAFKTLNTASVMLDQASALYYAAGNSTSNSTSVTNAQLIITEVTTSLTQLQTFLSSK